MRFLKLISFTYPKIQGFYYPGCLNFSNFQNIFGEGLQSILNFISQSDKGLIFRHIKGEYCQQFKKKLNFKIKFQNLNFKSYLPLKKSLIKEIQSPINSLTLCSK